MSSIAIPNPKLAYWSNLVIEHTTCCDNPPPKKTTMSFHSVGVSTAALQAKSRESWVSIPRGTT